MSIFNRIQSSLSFRYNHALRGYRKKIKRKKVHLCEFKPEENVYLFTDPRSGSTWLMEILNEMAATATLWEPFHPNHGTVDKKFNLGWRPYVNESKDWKELKDELTSVFSNKKTSDWTFSRSSLQDYQRAERLIVKSVRANALLPWIVNNFEFKNQPIYMLRHPIPQSLSHIRSFADNKDPFAPKKFILSKEMKELTSAENEAFLDTLSTQLECKVAQWCLTNHLTIRSEQRHKWKMVYYEDIVLHPEDEIQRILDGLGEISISLPELIKKPSWTSSQSLKENPKEQIEKWVGRLTDEQKERIERILKYFNLEGCYSAYSAYPIKNI